MFRKVPLPALLILLACGKPGGAPERRPDATDSSLAPFPVFAPHLNARIALFATAGRVRIEGPRALDTHVPQQFQGRTRIATSAEHSLELEPIGVRPSIGTIQQNSVVYRDVDADTDATVLIEPGRVEEVRVLRSTAAPTRASYRVHRGAGIAELRTRAGFVEALDREGRARLRMEPPFAVDAHGVRRGLTVVLDGDFLSVALDPRGLAYPIALDPAWGPTALLAIPRALHRAVLLPSGKVLVTGGETGPATATATAELYDPVARTWTLAASMATARAGHGLVLLDSGKAMAIGGTNTGWSETGAAAIASVELYDPATDTWSAGTPLPGARSFAAVAKVPSGRVAVIGGQIDATTASNQAYVYVPSTDSWSTSANTMPTTRSFVPPAVLASGKILVSGNLAWDPSASIFDPATLLFAAAANAPDGRVRNDAITLADGRVLCIGGSPYYYVLPTSAIYNPLTDSWSKQSLPTDYNSYFGELAAAAGNRVVATHFGEAPTTLSAIFDPVTTSWTTGPTLVRARMHHTATTLSDGRVLLAGGDTALAKSATVTPTATVEIYGDALVTGSTCSANSACASSVCSDGRCCDRACTGSCESCAVPGKEGTCSLITGAPPSDRPACGGTGACAGRCDGTSSGCAYPSGECVAASCTGGLATQQAFCDGAGACATKSVIVCGAYACGAVTCKTSCAADADCTGGRVCELSTSTCVDKKARGATCTSATECTSGFCADGVCCDKACDGACEACNVAASEGVCSKLDGVVDPKCGGGGCADVCKAGACSFKPATVACGATCTGATLSTAGTCSGTDDKCAGAGSSACPNNFKCKDDGSGCKTKCATNDDCAGAACDILGNCIVLADAGASDTAAPVVDTGIGVAETGTTLPATPKIGAEFQRCTKDSECATGHCVEGVCCDTGCETRCHSCALVASPGKCTPEPIGVDLKQECGPALSCLGTCNGGGECIGAGQGTMCARNRCVGPSNGVGPAYCAGPGANCNDDEAVAFDCSPYLCEPAFGACATTCRSSDDCARGFVCDVGAKTCVASAPPADEDTGCAMGRPNDSLTGISLLLAAFGGLIRRRRSRSLAPGIRQP